MRKVTKRKNKILGHDKKDCSKLTVKWFVKKGFVHVPLETATKGKGYLTKDFLGCFDHLFMTDGGGFLVQSTSDSNHATRRKKILSSPYAYLWLRAFDQGVFVVSWKIDNGKAGDPRIEELKADAFPKETISKAERMLNGGA